MNRYCGNGMMGGHMMSMGYSSYYKSPADVFLGKVCKFAVYVMLFIVFVNGFTDLFHNFREVAVAMVALSDMGTTGAQTIILFVVAGIMVLGAFTCWIGSRAIGAFGEIMDSWDVIEKQKRYKRMYGATVQPMPETEEADTVADTDVFKDETAE